MSLYIFQFKWNLHIFSTVTFLFGFYLFSSPVASVMKVSYPRANGLNVKWSFLLCKPLKCNIFKEHSQKNAREFMTMFYKKWKHIITVETYLVYLNCIAQTKTHLMSNPVCTINLMSAFLFRASKEKQDHQDLGEWSDHRYIQSEFPVRIHLLTDPESAGVRHILKLL